MMTPRRTSVVPVAAVERGAERHHPLRVVLLVAILLVSLAAGVLVKPSAAGASVPPRTDLEKKIDWAVLRLLNAQRALNGLRPLRMAPELRLSARRHNLQMAAYDEMSHQLPSEPDFAQRITNAGYKWSWAGENIAWNSDISLSGVKLLQRLMFHEKPPNDAHRLNILSTHYRNVGVDVYIDKRNEKIWLTTDFARPAG